MLSKTRYLLKPTNSMAITSYLSRNNFVSKKDSSSKDSGLRKVTVFPGDGIGPEITQSVVEIFAAVKAPIEWEFHKIHATGQTADGDLISQEAMNSMLVNKFALKGPFETPIGKGHRSFNVTLRKKMNLYANVRPCKSLKGIKSFYENVDLVTIRENTEGEYSGLEHVVVPGIVENFKIISKQACQNIAEYAFEYATKYNRKKVTACHKAGVQKLGDGLFIKTTRDVSQLYPNIKYEEEQVDTVCMKLARDPSVMDVMVMPNLYGDIVSDLCAGLIGGLGLTPSGNIGPGCSLYEAVHGTAPDIAGKNLANPTALLLSGCMMLDKMQLQEYSDKIRAAVFSTYEEGKYTTKDVGGKSGTNDYVNSVISRLQ
jgi:isocitrate dehydrogenase (NAD+)